MHAIFSKYLILLCFLFSPCAGAIDTILVNGKIVTVDDRFSIVQALAIRNQRVVATGSSVDIRKLADVNTKVIDVNGRTVIPGLIDNHSHWIRAAEHDELRFDGVTSRAQAVQLLTARVRVAKPGEWVSVLGGWSEEQFTDAPRGFPIGELDRIAPDTPLAVQSIYNHTYLNTAALRAAKIDENTPNPPNGTIEKDATGKLTGVVRGAGGVAFIAGKVPKLEAEARMANVRKLATYLNSLGITAWGDAGGRGMSAAHYTPYRELADKGELSVRVFWTTIRQPATPEQVDKVLTEIPTIKPFQGNDTMDHIGWGESVYSPITTQLLRVQKEVQRDGIVQMQRIAGALAQRGVYLNSHVEMNGPIEQFVAAYEELNKTTPIKGLRWSFSHLDQIDEQQLQRMKRLGMTAQIHSRPLIQGVLMHKVHGDAAWDMPPFRRVQDSGIVWGLGSDATAVTTSNPFYTLGLAITGKMVGGHHVNRQSITREEALIAHTRSNAFILFQEGNLGSLQKGKYADLLVLDRDYMTVTADAIKDLKPVMTMVGGKVVYDVAYQAKR